METNKPLYDNKELVKTWNEKILFALEKMGRPAKGAEIYEYILKVWPETDPDTLRVMLTYAINRAILFRIKYINSASFYVHPSWADEKGKLLPHLEFDRWKLTLTDKTKINAE